MGPLFHLLHTRINTLDLPKPVTHRIHPVRAAIHNHAATAEFAIHAPVPVGIIFGVLPSRPDGVPQSGFAERPTVKRPVNRALPNTAATLFGIRGDPIAAVGCLDNFLRGFNRYANGFFAQDIHTAFEQLTGEYVMQTVRAAYIGAIEIGFRIEQILNRGITIDLPSGFAIDLIGKRLCATDIAINRGDNAKAVFATVDKLSIPPKMPTGNTATADEREIYNFSSGHYASFLVLYSAIASQ